MLRESKHPKIKNQDFRCTKNKERRSNNNFFGVRKHRNKIGLGKKREKNRKKK